MEKPKRGMARNDACGQRSKFAEAIARAEFGRFYWNGRQTEQLEQAMKAPKPARRGNPKPKKA